MAPLRMQLRLKPSHMAGFLAVCLKIFAVRTFTNAVLLLS